MVKSRGCLRFLFKTKQPVWVAGCEEGEDLDRDFPFQCWIADAVDLTHSACTEQADNFIAIEFCARCQ